MQSRTPTAAATHAAAPALADLTDNAEREREVAKSEAPKDPWHRPARHTQYITHAASHGNIRALTGNTTAQLNRQELARQRSVAETPENSILGFFRSLFH